MAAGAQDRILDSALRVAARDGWHAASLAAVAAEAELSLLEVYRTFPSRTAILSGLLDRVDRAVLKDNTPDRSESVRDRLFDVLMRRFDALKPSKEAVAGIAHALARDPAAAACLGPRFLRSMAWMLEAAGLDSSGWRGALRAKGMVAIYLAGLRAWLADDTPDSARTMAAVDRALRRTESLVELCGRFGPRRRRGEPAEAPPAASKGARKRPRSRKARRS